MPESLGLGSFKPKAISAPAADPSRRNCTPATPTSSIAEALTVIVPEAVEPLAGAVMLTTGGVVSIGPVVVNVASLLTVSVPLLSLERTLKWYSVPPARPLTV